MRLAIVSDIHGNLTAFEAVLADLKTTAPDLILHCGDLAEGGPHPCEIVDRIRELGWQGVVGNTDEMLFRPESLTEFAAKAPKLAPMLAAIEEMGAAAKEALGAARLEWLSQLPQSHVQPPVALVHASPGNLWRAPVTDAPDAELASTYSPLGQPVAVHGHIHQPYVRRVGQMIVANSGSVSLSYDGDRRAAYLLLDDSKPSIRRVEYDVSKEIRALAASALPHSAWIAKTLESASPQMP
ncbi:MAG TPA: metallophosphoesterase family protein [Candidatus Sulfotelmatobacter sp.]|nr:metallophosphoesterase family protein [Candidatus Sulfotelmatobacter sp.]